MCPDHSAEKVSLSFENERKETGVTQLECVMSSSSGRWLRALGNQTGIVYLNTKPASMIYARLKS